MTKEKVYEDDFQIRYHCGCSESKLEPPEYWEKLCSIHQSEKSGAKK